MDGKALSRHFRRALRSCQLYPAGSPVREEAAAAFSQALAAANLGRTEGASLVFLEDGLWVDGQAVAPDGTPADAPLARQIFELGVRELRFLPGIATAELVRFFDPLARALLGQLNPVDEDLSVLLWEADLTHIGYLLYEEPQPEPVLLPEGEGSCKTYPTLDEYVDGELTIGAAEPEGWTARLGEAECLQILAAYRREEEDEIPLKYGRLLLEVLREDGDPAESGRFLRSLLEYLEALGATGRFHTLERLRAAMLPVSDLSAPALAALEEIRTWFDGPGLCMRAAEITPDGAQDREGALSVLARAPTKILPELVARATDPEVEQSAEVRSAILHRLTKDPEAQLLCLRDSRSSVRKSALEVTTPGTEGVRYLREALKDPEAEVRRLAVRALGRAAGSAGIPGIVQALSDPEEGVRITAAETLGQMGGPQALEPLLRVLISHDLERRGQAEKRTICMSAARAAPKEVLPVLARMAERRMLWISHERRVKADLAQEALAGLWPEARTFLSERWARHRPGLLRALQARSSAELRRGAAPLEKAA